MYMIEYCSYEEGLYKYMGERITITSEEPVCAFEGTTSTKLKILNNDIQTISESTLTPNTIQGRTFSKDS